MRIFIVAFLAFSLASSEQILAQSPGSFNYQTIIRDANGDPVTSAVSLRFTLHRNSASGNIVYEETVQRQPNQFGLINVFIGEQFPGDFESVNWADGTYYLGIEIDQGSGFEDVGQPQLIRSVPFALHSRTAMHASSADYGEDDDSDPTNEIQTWFDLPGIPTGFSDNIDDVEDDDSDPTNELQSWDDLPGIPSGFADDTDDVNDNDSDPTNELQTWQTLPGIPAAFEDGVDNVNDNDSDPSNELQTLSLSGNIISLSDGGGSVSRLWSADGSTAYYTSNVRIGSSSIGSSRLNVISSLATYAANSNRLFRTTSSTGGGGYISTHGPGGTENCRFTNHSSSGDRGYFSVRDANGAEQAGVYVNANNDGIVFGDTKNFRMDHPLDSGKEIWYACVEGPEAAAYTRGTSTLINGEANVEFTEDFMLVINPATMTIQVTPGSADSYGLAVVEKTSGGFRVKELAGGTGNFSFDWEVKAVRKGYEDYKPVRRKVELSNGPLEEEVANY